jgi:hypothetical protein
VIALSTLGGATAGFIYSQPATTRPDAFAAFADIPVLATALPPTNLSHLELLEASGGQVGWTANRHDYRGVSTQIDGDMYVDMYNFWAERAADVYSKTGANQTFVIQPVTANLARKSVENGGNALGLSPSEGISCKFYLLKPTSLPGVGPCHSKSRTNVLRFLS